MIIDFTRLVKVDPKRYEDLKKEKEAIISFDSEGDGDDCYRGDLIVVEADNNADEKEKQFFEVLAVEYDSKADRFTARIGHVKEREDHILG